MQLRHFALNRLRFEGREVEREGPQWVDAYRPDSYHWKVEPNLAWETTGPSTNLLVSAIDYLHAYWLFRYYQLDEEPVVRERHATVLGDASSGSHAELGP